MLQMWINLPGQADRRVWKIEYMVRTTIGTLLHKLSMPITKQQLRIFRTQLAKKGILFFLRRTEIITIWYPFPHSLTGKRREKRASWLRTICCCREKRKKEASSLRCGVKSLWLSENVRTYVRMAAGSVSWMEKKRATLMILFCPAVQWMEGRKRIRRCRRRRYDTSMKRRTTVSFRSYSNIYRTRISLLLVLSLYVANFRITCHR